MATVTVQKQIDASVQDVWESWADFGNIYKFNPNLSHSRLLSDPSEPVGVGSTRHCDMADNKNWIRERIVDFQPLKKVKIDVYQGTLPLKSMFATFDFQKNSDEQTTVRMTVDFQPKMGALGQLMVPLMKRRFQPMLQALLDCNAAHVEHGETAPAAA